MGGGGGCGGGGCNGSCDGGLLTARKARGPLGTGRNKDGEAKVIPLAAGDGLELDDNGPPPPKPGIGVSDERYGGSDGRREVLLMEGMMLGAIDGEGDSVNGDALNERG